MCEVLVNIGPKGCGSPFCRACNGSATAHHRAEMVAVAEDAERAGWDGALHTATYDLAGDHCGRGFPISASDAYDMAGSRGTGSLAVLWGRVFESVGLGRDQWVMSASPEWGGRSGALHFHCIVLWDASNLDFQAGRALFLRIQAEAERVWCHVWKLGLARRPGTKDRGIGCRVDCRKYDSTGQKQTDHSLGGMARYACKYVGKASDSLPDWVRDRSHLRAYRACSRWKSWARGLRAAVEGFIDYDSGLCEAERSERLALVDRRRWMFSASLRAAVSVGASAGVCSDVDFSALPSAERVALGRWWEVVTCGDFDDHIALGIVARVVCRAGYLESLGLPKSVFMGVEDVEAFGRAVVAALWQIHAITSGVEDVQAVKRTIGERLDACGLSCCGWADDGSRFDLPASPDDFLAFFPEALSIESHRWDDSPDPRPWGRVRLQVDLDRLGWKFWESAGLGAAPDVMLPVDVQWAAGRQVGLLDRYGGKFNCWLPSEVVERVEGGLDRLQPGERLRVWLRVRSLSFKGRGWRPVWEFGCCYSVPDWEKIRPLESVAFDAAMAAASSEASSGVGVLV